MNTSTYAKDLLATAQGCIEQGRYRTATRLLEQALRLEPTQEIACSLAVVKGLLGEHLGVIECLKSYAEADERTPEVSAHMSLAHSALSQREQALKYAARAASDFESKAKSSDVTAGANLSSWLAEASSVMRALGASGDHEKVMQVFGLVRESAGPEQMFIAGIAAWNLGDFKRASQIWREASALRTDLPVDRLAAVAGLLDSGLVPNFELDYCLPKDEDLFETDEEEQDEDTAPESATLNSMELVRRLYLALCRPSVERERLIWELVLFSDNWGESLASNLLNAPDVGSSLKMAAAQALLLAGKIEQDEVICMNYRGETLSVSLDRIALVERDPIYESRMLAALGLLLEDRPHEALVALEDVAPPGEAYLPAMINRARLLATMGYRDMANSVLKHLEDVLPDEPTVKQLASDLEDATPLPYGISRFGRDHLRGQEGPALEQHITLAQALKRQGFRYINELCAAHALTEAGKRPAKEQALMKILSSAEQIATKLRAETEAVLRAAESVLDAGGWMRLDDLERLYGPREKDEIYRWSPNEQTTLGRLERLGLLFSGRLFASKDNVALAVIPIDVRAHLASALALLGRTKRQIAEPAHVKERSQEINEPACVRLRLELKDVKPTVWRLLEVPGDITLHDLHKVIQIAADWSDYHLYRFEISGLCYSLPNAEDKWLGIECINSKKTVLSSVLTEGMSFEYVYDFGDNWVHLLQVERIHVLEEPMSCASCLAGERAFPPEDAGGLPGYARLMRILDDPDHPQHEEYSLWSQGWDPDHFSNAAIDKQLAKLTLSRGAKESRNKRSAKPKSSSRELDALAGEPRDSAVFGDPYDELSAVLREIGCTTSPHTYRGLILGSCMADRMVPLSEIMRIAWEGEEFVFESQEHVMRLLRVLAAEWNKTSSSVQSCKVSLWPFGKIRSSDHLIRYAAARKDEISGFLHTFEMGSAESGLTNVAKVLIPRLQTVLDSVLRLLEHLQSSKGRVTGLSVLEDEFRKMDQVVENTLNFMAADQEFRRTQSAVAKSGQASKTRVGRNEPCPCGSGKKYKHCCGTA